MTAGADRGGGSNRSSTGGPTGTPGPAWWSGCRRRLTARLTPAVAHLHSGFCAGVLAAATVLLTAGAVVTFRRRAAL